MSLSMIDGPAADECIGCRRAPALLRVVQSPSGKWDALDQLDDEPRPRETIHIYECAHNFGGAFMCPGGWQESADYRHIITGRGELDAIVRDTATWRAFAAAYFGVTLAPDGTRIADAVPIKRGSE